MSNNLGSQYKIQKYKHNTIYRAARYFPWVSFQQNNYVWKPSLDWNGFSVIISDVMIDVRANLYGQIYALAWAHATRVQMPVDLVTCPPNLSEKILANISTKPLIGNSQKP